MCAGNILETPIFSFAFFPFFFSLVFFPCKNANTLYIYMRTVSATPQPCTALISYTSNGLKLYDRRTLSYSFHSESCYYLFFFHFIMSISIHRLDDINKPKIHRAKIIATEILWWILWKSFPTNENVYMVGLRESALFGIVFHLLLIFFLIFPVDN